MQKYKKLFNNSILFAIGNLGSKFITFIMLPLYTARMVPSAYGLVDIITTTSGLLLPIVSMNVFDAVLRFTMDRSADTKSIYTNSVRVAFLGTGISLLSVPIFYIFYKPFVVLPILMALQTFQALYTQFAKGIERISLYAFNGILLTALTAGLNIIFLWPLNMGFTGYFLSTCLALLMSNLMLYFRLNVSSYYDKSKISRAETKKILEFSTPLIPTTVAWSISNTAGRYAILMFLGTSANGLFAVASKIPAVLATLTNIFGQAWQLAAIEEFDSNDDSGDNFFDAIYRVYIALLFVGASIILIFVQPLMHIIVADAYYAAWQFIPLLLLSVIFNSLSGFLGSQYVAAKRTVEIFKTTFLGSATSVVFSFLLVKPLGINAASIASFASFFLIWLVRHVDLMKTMESLVTVRNILAQTSLFIVQYLAMFISITWFAYSLQFICLFLLIYSNWSIIGKILQIGLKVIKRRI